MCNSPKYYTGHMWIITNSPPVSVDHSRVKLTLTTSKNDADYINANFIKVCQQCTCTQQHIQLLLQYLPLLAHANLKCVSFQANFFWLLWHEAVFLSSGSIRFSDIHCDPGSSTPHCTGLLEDALGVRNKGTGPASPASFTIWIHMRRRWNGPVVKKCILFFLMPSNCWSRCGYDVFWWFGDSDCHVCPKVVIMACREFEMGKVGLYCLHTKQLLHLFAKLVCMLSSSLWHFVL